MTDSDQQDDRQIIVLHEEPNYAVMWRSAADLGFSKYEVNPDGFGRGQLPVRNRITGKPQTVSVGGNGYLRVKPYDDDGKQRTIEVHAMVLGVYAGAAQAGMETRHLDSDPFNNRWRPGDEAETRAAGGNLIYGTKKEQHTDRVAAGTARTPAMYPCINHERCGGMVVNPGRRCLPCVKEVGRDAAAMLNAGLVLEEVMRRLDYKSRPWMEKIARDYGGFTGPLPQLNVRRRQPLLHRVTATLRYRLKITRRR